MDIMAQFDIVREKLDQAVEVLKEKEQVSGRGYIN